MKTLSEVEKKVLAAIQHGMGNSITPYADAARKAGISTDELLAVLRNWDENGVLRRVGAIVSHFEVGLGAGMMVVWQVPEERVEEVGMVLAGFPEVSHAYQRPAGANWPYNLYTMVHGENNETVKATVQRMSTACGIDNYKGLETRRELKKVPPTYIKLPNGSD